MSKKIVIDTNILLDDPTVLYKLSKEYEQIVIPITVLKELDKHKFNKDLSYSARNAIHELLAFKTEHPTKIHFTVDEHELDEQSNDLKIIDSAIKNDADIATKDISMSIISDAKGVETKLYSTISNGLHNPNKYIELVDIDDNFEYAQEYYEGGYDILFNMVDKSQEETLSKESWFFVFMQNEGTNMALYANNPLEREFVRLDTQPAFRSYSVDGHTLKAKDWYQICAIYALRESPNVLLTGKWGSGKTLLGTAQGLQNRNRKTFIMRPPIGISGKYNIGFLPGDKDEKLIGWCSGFLSALYFIYSNTSNQSCDKDEGSGVSFDYVKERIFKEKFELVPLNGVQGMSLLADDTMIVDEVQLIDIDTLSMILSRANEGSKLIMLGDLAQTYKVVRPSESGLLKLLRALPHHALCHVDLQNHYRNDLLEIADLLQDKSF